MLPEVIMSRNQPTTREDTDLLSERRLDATLEESNYRTIVLILRLRCSLHLLSCSGSYSMTGGMRVRSGGGEHMGAQSRVGE
ncbi:hypothetical protein J6590_015285 [Homalodisca vitripennis]|nr:hypothetical protein J6590_015285 [Homalodisca vitripennis]